MCIKILLILFITIVGNEIVHTRSVRRHEIKDNRAPVTPYGSNNYDYDYETAYRQNPNPTTQRPFFSYWQNIMRNVRVPVPSITWNVTNPLMNLFNMGEEQPIHSAPADEHNSFNSERRRKKRRRKSSHKKRTRKNKLPIENVEQQQQNELSPQEQEIFLEPYPNPIAMYYYDPNTGAYYTVQNVRTLDSYIDGVYYDPKQKNYVDTKRKANKAQAPISDLSNLDNTEHMSTEEGNIETDINLDEHFVEEIDLDKVDITQALKNAESKKKSKKPSKNDESLRSILGSYTHDDHFNRQRQRAKDQRRESSTFNQKPRNNKKYFLRINKS